MQSISNRFWFFFDVNIFEFYFFNSVNLHVETIKEPLQSPSWSETAKHGKGYDFYQYLFILISIFYCNVYY